MVLAALIMEGIWLVRCVLRVTAFLTRKDSMTANSKPVDLKKDPSTRDACSKPDKQQMQNEQPMPTKPIPCTRIMDLHIVMTCTNALNSLMPGMSEEVVVLKQDLHSGTCM
mmetsp:Transcript_39647/g.74349  ORF Transcript_39647/g.74349 Transcript_39647/m.74349 type:complete len:111 (-) Transcript_39647:257-589(-)